MDILGIDLGTQFAWAYGPERVEHGFDRLPDVSEGRLLCMYADLLVNLVNRRRPDRIAIEMPLILQKKFQPMHIRRSHMLLGVTHMVGHRFGALTNELSVSTIKARFVGHGFAPKDRIMEECRRRGWDPENEDVGDALATMAAYAEMHHGERS